MSHAGTILGISELEIERVHRHDFIEVWAKPTKKPLCKHCESRQLRIKATHKRTVKHTRQGNQVLTLHLKVPKYHCRCCGIISGILLLGFGLATGRRSAFA